MRSPRTHALWTEVNCPHFISTNTYERKPLFVDTDVAEMLIDEMKFYAVKYNVLLIAAVVMPDHFHCIIWPQGQKTFSDFMYGVKSYMAKWFSEREVQRGMVTPPIIIKKIWQDSFFDYVIESDEKLEEKVWYIIRNPVEDGLISEVEVYPHLLVDSEYDPR